MIFSLYKKRESDLKFFFFKQKTAYEMCGRDWSSDVCSSDLWAEQSGDVLSSESTTPK